MKYIVLLFFIVYFFLPVLAQPEIANQLQKRYEIQNGFKSIVKIKLDVPGIVAPEKTIEIYGENGKQMKIKGDGLILLPKRGFVKQFSELLTIPVHWILLENYEDFVIYKLVSLDSKSDWVTADIKIYIPDPRIDEMTLTTRESGVFFIKHFYDSGKYPIRSEINFVTDKLSIPLKFMGKSDFSEVKDSTGRVNGNVFLEFTNFELF
ncbi:hypothetical protein N9164_06665 [Draconibacterium sp.]|nr:hypothetical protein [Draconibacterium sp.]